MARQIRLQPIPSIEPGGDERVEPVLRALKEAVDVRIFGAAGDDQRAVTRAELEEMIAAALASQNQG